MARREYTRTVFLDADGITRNFERWPYKRISTAKEKTIWLFQQLGNWAIKDLQKNGVIVVSFGKVNPDAKNEYDYTEQERMDFTEFVQLVEAGRH